MQQRSHAEKAERRTSGATNVRHFNHECIIYITVKTSLVKLTEKKR